MYNLPFISIFNIRLQETCIIDNEISFMSCIISMGHSSFANLPPSYLLSSDYSVVKENLSLSWVSLECQHRRYNCTHWSWGPKKWATSKNRFTTMGRVSCDFFLLCWWIIGFKEGSGTYGKLFWSLLISYSHMSSALHHHIIHAVIFLFLIS